MRWTKAHSANAVAAKRRLRILRASEPLLDEPSSQFFHPRKLKPDVKINIEFRNGERVQITATKFGSKFITTDGMKSAGGIARGIELILKYCT